MPVTDDEVAALRALLKGDIVRHNELFAKINQDRPAMYYSALLAAAFGEAVMRRFGNGHTRREIAEFVAETRAWSDNPAARIDQDAGERVIGAVLGEAPAQDADTDDDAEFDAQFQLLIALVAAGKPNDASLDSFLADARTRADEMIEAAYGPS